MLIQTKTPINAELFSEPHLSKQIHFARKGMLNPSRDIVTPELNRHLYRLGHSIYSDEKNLSSPWWNDFQNFTSLKVFAETNSISLTLSSRIQNAQSPDFGPADVLYVVELAEPLYVLMGLGRPIMSADGRLYSPPNAVTQTFIPGLRAWPDEQLSAIGKRAFKSVKTSSVPRGMITINGE